MGTSLDLSYSNLFFDQFETQALMVYHLRPIAWKPFIGDIFLMSKVFLKPLLIVLIRLYNFRDKLCSLQIKYPARVLYTK